MSNRLAGKVAVVTGGAQGIGMCTVEHFVREGAKVMLADIDADRARSAAQRIDPSGNCVQVSVTDVLQTGQINDLMGRAKETWGRLDILVNSAGGFHRFSSIEETSDEDWQWVVDLNLGSTFRCCRAAVPIMKSQGSGRIINIASLAGVAPNPHAPSYLPYGTAKAAVIGFTKLLARDVGPFGITVNAISPGTTATERVRKVRDSASLAEIASRNPLKVLVEPEDSAAAAVYFASDDACRVTGTNLNVNAGAIM
jgi:3-oxoacyl-[acyl-carrier protein] reductase